MSMIPGSEGKDLGNNVYLYTCQFCGTDYLTPYPNNGFDICPKCSQTKEGKKYVQLRNRYNYLDSKAEWYTHRASEVYDEYKVSLRNARLAINGGEVDSHD